MSSHSEKSSNSIEAQSLDEVEFRDFFRFLYLNRKGALWGAAFASLFTLGWVSFNLPSKVFRINFAVSPDAGPSIKEPMIVTNWLNQAFFEQETRRNLAINLGMKPESFDRNKFKFEFIEGRYFELKIIPTGMPDNSSIDTKKFIHEFNRTVTQRFEKGVDERVSNFQRSLAGVLEASIGMDDFYKKIESKMDAERSLENVKIFEIQHELDLVESKKSLEVPRVENSMFLIEQLRLRAASLAFRKLISNERYENIQSRLDVLDLDMRKYFMNRLPREYLYTHVAESLSQLETSIRNDIDPRKTAVPTFVESATGESNLIILFNRRGLAIFAGASLVFLSVCGLVFSGIVKFFVRNRNYIMRGSE